MNRKDIANLNNIMSRILTEAAESGVEIKRVDFTPEEAEAKYEEADAHPYLYTTGDGKPVVLFFLQQHSDTEAWLHRSDGPAIVIEEGGPGKEFYFLDGKEVEKADIMSSQNQAARQQRLFAKRQKNAGIADLTKGYDEPEGDGGGDSSWEFIGR